MVADDGCVSGDAQWMLNTAGQTPCQVAESLVRVCAATARVQLLPADVTCSTLGVPNNASCCCSTVTYALAAACLVCQTGRTDLQPSTTYAAWLADCSTIAAVGTLPAIVRFADPPVLVPRWAHVRPANLSSRWDIALAQRAVNRSPISTSSPPAIPSPSALSAASASSTTPDPPPDPPKPTFPAAPVVIVCVGALVLVLAMAHWLYKRRNRVSPSARPPPGFSIDDDPSPPPVQRDEESAGGWMSRWKKSKSKNGGGSDPGKIDAWHYPFDYTPVSVADSGSSPSHKHQHHPSGSHQPYYDPYVAGGSTSRVTLQLDEPNAEDRRRERHERRARRDERHARSSSETRLIPRGRVSSETLRPGTAPGQGLMPQTSMATLSPTPGYAIPPGYTASPMYLHPGVSRSHVGTPVPPGQPLFGSSVTAYVSTAPPTPTPGPSTPRAGGHSPVPLPTLPPPSQPRSGHSPRPHTHTHTFEVRLNPDQYAELRSRYPELQVRTKKHKRRGRDRGEGQPDEEERRGRPRSWSMPVQPPAPEVGGGAGDDDDDLDDGDRRPRNGPELAEKYRRRRRRRGTDAEAPKEEVVSVVQGPLNEVRRDKGRSRAVDGGVSLMGGPPVVR